MNYKCTIVRSGCFGVPDIYLLLSGFVAEIQTLAIRQVPDIDQHPPEDGTLIIYRRTGSVFW